eukprot:gnl/Trimastix_PCT/1075.p1 GENE.gnl/Trimastix_PCT/1075~~gnl/Trimastix_PCT/1075.p1  ORF type:complete len:403 (-),score=47.25 gnl/Trimastix_PCT/1075:8-1066(-)
MLADEDGKLIAGTVGGGSLEGYALEQCKVLLQSETHSPCLIEYHLTSDLASNSGMVCGGLARFLVEPLNDSFREPFELAYQCFREHLPGIECLQVEGADAPWIPNITTGPLSSTQVKRAVLAQPAGTELRHTGTLGSEALDARARQILIDDPQRDYFELREDWGSSPVFLNSLLLPPCVLLFGGGHCGYTIAQAAHLAGFAVHVYDDRAEFANPERFPMAAEARAIDFEHIPLDELPLGPQSYVVAVTRGHAFDYHCMHQLLRTGCKYYGMIGSRSKVTRVMDRLRANGYSEAELARVFAPIGLRIGGTTPGEIAISVVAQLLQVRYAASEEEARCPPGLMTLARQNPDSIQ